jgi:HEPN domain-containing protein
MAMPDKDPSHWLLRLSPAEWLAAAATELGSAQAALARRSYRPGVTHLRRAAGMACNALLWQGERPGWGRSYMEHVTALGDDLDVPADVRAAARRLRETPAAAPALVALVRPGQLPDNATEILHAATTIIDWAAAQIS